VRSVPSLIVYSSLIVRRPTSLVRQTRAVQGHHCADAAMVMVLCCRRAQRYSERTYRLGRQLMTVSVAATECLIRQRFCVRSMERLFMQRRPRKRLGRFEPQVCSTYHLLLPQRKQGTEQLCQAMAGNGARRGDPCYTRN
jgi:hypothetical protein